MEAYRHAHLAHTRTPYLTKLYTDAKKRAIISIDVKPPLSVPPAYSAEQFTALLRKFRIQKDRFSTWGLAWNDDGKGLEGNIDDAVARAGFTEIVESVMRNVDEVLAELESINYGSATMKAGEKVASPVPFNESRYIELLSEYTAAIDILYDLSNSRKAIARGEHPTFEPHVYAETASTRASTVPAPRVSHHAPSVADSERTLVNALPFLRPSLSPYAGLPPRIELSALMLPEEGPPPYESLGVPITTRLVGHLLRSRTSESVQSALGSSASEVPVLVEYANYDSTYQDTGVPPPLQRLESLATAFQPMRQDSQYNISLLGYFEDPSAPRIGLVYDLPYAVQNRLHATAAHDAETLTPLSLLNVIRKAKPSSRQSQVDDEPPPLETRFKLALRLTEQLYALHTQELPHGNINSSSVIFAITSSDTSSARQKQLRSPIWASFDVFSKCTVEGLRRPANLNIYRHPKDQPQDADRDITTDIRHDLYGLALLLLEIGLWHPLGDLYKPKYTLPDFKTRLDKLWTPKLAAKCGTQYMRAVQACLRAIDARDADRLTTEGIYELVLPRLRRCCYLDSESEDLSEPAWSTAASRAVSTSSSDRLSRRSTDVPRTIPEDRAMHLERHTSLPALSPATSTLSEPAAQSVVHMPAMPRQLSASSMRDSFAQRMSSQPTFKEKVVKIQKRWKEYCDTGVAPGETQADAPDDLQVTKLSSLTTGRIHSGEMPAQVEHRIKPKLQEYPMLQIPQAVQEDWNNTTAVELARLVKHALKGSRESCSINLTSYGESAETARPTYLVTCKSTQHVKQILKRHFRCDPKACYVRVEKGRISRCRKARRESAAHVAMRTMAPRFEQDYDAVNPDYQQQPVCGASIGAYRDEEHLPPVSFGGIVTVDGRSYGMSVHHMLEIDEEAEEDFDDDDDGSDTSSLLSLSDEAISLDSEDDSTVRQLSIPSDLSLEEEYRADGETAGIMPGEGQDIEITQPALDDAISANLHADEEDEDDEDSGVDEDHILSYKLGQVHASSGLKRSTFHTTEAGYRGLSSSLPQEIDWALFELLPPRAHPFNVIRGGRKYCDTTSTHTGLDCFPIAVKGSGELAGARVHCLGRTSGLASGVISSTMELLKLHGRSTFAASWTVHGGFGVGGDSGAWVVSSDGQVCGHVLAERAGRTYICPMDLLFEDIRETLGAADVALPALLTEGGNTQEEETSTGIEQTLARLRFDETGGVPLPCSPTRKLMAPHCEQMVRSVRHLSSAG